MLPAAAYTSAGVLAWERRQFFAGTWTCLGREDELPGDAAVTQHATVAGDVPVLLTGGPRLRAFANTCRHRGTDCCAPNEDAVHRFITMVARGYLGQPLDGRAGDRAS